MTFICDGKECESLDTLIRTLGLERNIWICGANYKEMLLRELIYNRDYREIVKNL